MKYFQGAVSTTIRCATAMLGSSLFSDCFFGGFLISHWRSFCCVISLCIFRGSIAGADPYLCSRYVYTNCKANKEWYQHDKNNSVSTFTSSRLDILAALRGNQRRLACVNDLQVGSGRSLTYAIKHSQECHTILHPRPKFVRQMQATYFLVVFFDANTVNKPSKQDSTKALSY
jgi:hypothetical protein